MFCTIYVITDTLTIKWKKKVQLSFYQTLIIYKVTIAPTGSNHYPSISALAACWNS